MLTFGAINGGIRYNIIPDEVEMVGTIRTFDEGMRQQIFADLRNVVAGDLSPDGQGELAIERGQNHVSPLHLLAALVLQEESLVFSMLDRMEVDTNMLGDAVLEHLEAPESASVPLWRIVMSRA